MHRIVILDPRSVIVGERHRKDMGTPEQMADLTESIRAKGLLQNIAVTPDNKLIWGERRLRIVRDILGWDTIAASVYDVDALGIDPVALEHDENEMRKSFSVSEKVAIARTMKERAGERRGNPALRNGENTAENPIRQKIDELETAIPSTSAERTDEAVAKSAGLGNRTTLRQAEKVVDQGAPELVEAMDAGTISISAAAEVAALPAEKQAEVVEKVKEGKKPRTAIAEVKAEEVKPAAEAPKEVAQPALFDSWDIPVQPHALAAFAPEVLAEFKRVVGLLKEAQGALTALVDGPGGGHLIKLCQWVKNGSKAGGAWKLSHLENAIKDIESCRPTVTDCPYAFNDEGKHPENCKLCHNLRWLASVKGHQIPPALTAAMKAHYGVAEDE